MLDMFVKGQEQSVVSLRRPKGKKPGGQVFLLRMPTLTSDDEPLERSVLPNEEPNLVLK
jgi:hypothetical protein